MLLTILYFLSIILFMVPHALTKKQVYSFLIKYGVITLGCIIYAMGVALFLDANDLASGGVTGIAIAINFILEQFTPLSHNTGTIILIINIPLFILGGVFFGRKFLISTVYSTVLSSLLIRLFDFLFTTFYHLPIVENTLLAALIGGALFGGGLGLIFRMGSSTGGTDVIIKILRKKFRYVRTGVISFAIDATIVLASAFIYQNIELTCYTVISIVVFSLTFDAVLYGGNSAKLIYIISEGESAELIAQRLLNELDVGATFVDGEGAYTGAGKRIIMVAIKNFLYPKLRDVVRAVDPKAFVIVSSAKEIYGEGYKNHFDDDV